MQALNNQSPRCNLVNAINNSQNHTAVLPSLLDLAKLLMSSVHLVKANITVYPSVIICSCHFSPDVLSINYKYLLLQGPKRKVPTNNPAQRIKIQNSSLATAEQQHIGGQCDSERGAGVVRLLTFSASRAARFGTVPRLGLQ